MEKESIRVCFCTPEADFGGVVGRALGSGFDVKVEAGDKLAAAGWQDNYDCVLLDLRELPTPADRIAERRLFDKFREWEVSLPIVAMVDDDDTARLRQLVEAGAYDVLASPLDVVELRAVLRRARRLHRVEVELQRLRAVENSQDRLDDLIGFTESMHEVFAMARKVAPCDVNVLITGETGTGKSLLGRAVHRLSPHHAGPFVTFSCANLPEHLVEDELFGHEKGSFTGALMLRRGRFEVANGGTLFLDEIGDLPLGLQSKLLRVLQDRSFERLGSNTPLTVDVRLVCATHRNLEEMVERGEFREDLYYRLNGITLELPALQRRRDKDALIRRCIAREASGQEPAAIELAALDQLIAYAWPGNIRELRNVIRRALAICENRVIRLSDLPPEIRHCGQPPSPAAAAMAALGAEAGESAAARTRGALAQAERQALLETIERLHGNMTQVAAQLGLSRNTLYRKLKRHGIAVGIRRLAPG